MAWDKIFSLSKLLWNWNPSLPLGSNILPLWNNFTKLLFLKKSYKLKELPYVKLNYRNETVLKRTMLQTFLTNFHILKFRLGTEGWWNKTREIILRLNNELSISVVLLISPSVGAKYEFQYVEIGLLLNLYLRMSVRVSYLIVKCEIHAFI